MKILVTFAMASALFLMACNSTVNDTEKLESEDSREAYSEMPASLPSFRMIDATGQPVNLDQFKGKKVFVNLWATWCGPCRTEMPSIEKLYGSSDKSKSAFIMLALDRDFETAKNYVAKKELNLPIYYPAENLPQLFQTQGIPATFIFNEKGQLVKRMIGMEDYSTSAYTNLFK